MDQFIMPQLAYSSTFVGILDEYRFGLNHESLDDWLARRYSRYGTEHILFLPPVEEEEEEDPFWQRQQLN